MVAPRWADVDLDRSSVAISRGIVASLDGLVEKDTKTHAARRVSLDPTCAATMRAHRSRAVERARLAECELSPLAFVFSYEVDGSKSWHPDSVSRTFTRPQGGAAGGASARSSPLRGHPPAGLRRRRPHRRAGRIGHRNASTTLNVYSHFLAEADRDAANLLGKIFDDAVAGVSEAPAVDDDAGPTSRSA